MAKAHPSGFVERLREIETALLGPALDERDRSRIKNDGEYSWLYRPSHHAETGLIKESDIEKLTTGRLLSIGAGNGALERVLLELGVPGGNIVAADSNPAILKAEDMTEKRVFDATEAWPAIGSFRLILFPESLCIMIRDKLKTMPGAKAERPFPTDEAEATMLAVILKQALLHLETGGEIRANGPMSHPNVVKAAETLLAKEGYGVTIDYARFFMTVTRA